MSKLKTIKTDKAWRESHHCYGFNYFRKEQLLPGNKKVWPVKPVKSVKEAK